MMGSLPVVLVDSPASCGRLVSDPRRGIFTKVAPSFSLGGMHSSSSHDGDPWLL